MTATGGKQFAAVKRRYRVRDAERFQEVRRQGRSYSNELLVLCALPNRLGYSRFGFSVNSRIGKAVVRNQIKRRLREIVRLSMDRIRPGWDIIFVARRPIRSADYHEMEAACARLLWRAQLFVDGETAPPANPSAMWLAEPQVTECDVPEQRDESE